jgi:hypothetical protein
MMRKMRQLQINPDWALGRDKAQWILRGRSGTRWHDIAFILSTKHVLARCRHENGVPAHDDQNILNSRIRLLEWTATSQKPRQQTQIPPPLQRPPKQKLIAISSASY